MMADINWKERYEELVAAVRKLPGGDPRLEEAPVVIALTAAEQIATLMEHAKANGRRFVVHYGWQNWAEHVVMPTDRKSRIHRQKPPAERPTRPARKLP